jgi:methionyl-tRNA formyltransferase
MKAAFMGTPDFAVPVLEQLISDKNYEVTVVVTQPDKARGRSGKLSFSPVKETAKKNNIPVFQPIRIKKKESIQALKVYTFDVIVVVAFGQILPKEILDMPKYGCINVHASLLPRWRGAAPIQHAILAGDTETGITTMQMDEGLDTGHILLTEKITIGKKETGGELFDRLSLLGAKLLIKTLDRLSSDKIKPQPQDNDNSTYAKMLSKEQGRLDFAKSAVELERTVRGLNPWPSAYTTYKGKMLKIWEADIEEEPDVCKDTEQEAIGEENPDTPFGTGRIVWVSKDAFAIKTGTGNLIIRELQWEGKKRMKTADFLRGVTVEKGSRCI